MGKLATRAKIRLKPSTAARMEILAILRQDIASKYLAAVPQGLEKDVALALCELILSFLVSLTPREVMVRRVVCGR